MTATKRLQKNRPAADVHLNELLDEALQETFPASDPVAIDVELDLLKHGMSPAPAASGSRPPDPRYTRESDD